eukprot:1342526-Pyramimonas_sp.AAC.1
MRFGRTSNFRLGGWLRDSGQLILKTPEVGARNRWEAVAGWPQRRTRDVSRNQLSDGRWRRIRMISRCRRCAAHPELMPRRVALIKDVEEHVAE